MPAGSGNRAHFSMIRQFHLADVFTLVNGALGTGAVLAFMRFLSTAARHSSGSVPRSFRSRW